MTTTRLRFASFFVSALLGLASHAALADSCTGYGLVGCSISCEPPQRAHCEDGPVPNEHSPGGPAYCACVEAPAPEEKPIAYDCAHIPPFCPQFAVVGGVTCVARHPQSGKSYRAHSAKNACWAEHAVARQICADAGHPPSFLVACHQGQ